MSTGERAVVLSTYALTSHMFAQAVERLCALDDRDVEAFIRALAEVGTAHRACERARVAVDKHLAHPLNARLCP